MDPLVAKSNLQRERQHLFNTSLRGPVEIKDNILTLHAKLVNVWTMEAICEQWLQQKWQCSVAGFRQSI